MRRAAERCATSWSGAGLQKGRGALGRGGPLVARGGGLLRFQQRHLEAAGEGFGSCQIFLRFESLATVLAASSCSEEQGTGLRARVVRERASLWNCSRGSSPCAATTACGAAATLATLPPPRGPAGARAAGASVPAAAGAGVGSKDAWWGHRDKGDVSFFYLA